MESVDLPQPEVPTKATRLPGCNYGIATGADAGNLFVIDCDVDDSKGEDGISTLRAWEASHGELPEGPVVTTPRGGMHLYFWSDRPVQCSTNAELGVDVRGDGGYVVGPGSVLDNGCYEWDVDVDDAAIPAADENVYAFLANVQRGKEGGRPRKFVLPDRIPDGERTDTLFRYACSLRASIVDERLLAASVTGVNLALCRPPLPQNEVDVIIAGACKYKPGKSKSIAEKQAVTRMLARNGRGVPLRTIDNCMTVVNNDVHLAGRFAYDEMAYARTVKLPLPWDGGEGSRQISDVDYTQLAAYVERLYGISAKGAVVDAVANVCSENRHNPVVDWLESLRWDGVDRIPDLLPVFLGAERTEYTTEVMRLFMRGACARIAEPGCKFDTMIVLVGDQGIGKSEFLRKLAHDPAWFNDNLNTIEGDAAVEKIRGMWICEMAELLASKRTQDVEAIKAFVTSRVDTIRPKYARETEQRPRCCVFAGTTNDMQFLSDPTGNRRFLPIRCLAKRPSQAMFDEGAQGHIDMCWAQAWAEWKGGERDLRLPDGLLDEADGVRAEYTEDDPRIGMVQAYLDGLLDTTAPERVRVCATEVLERALDVKDARNAPKKLVKEVHQILSRKTVGWERYKGNISGKMRTDYGVQVCYVPVKTAIHGNGNAQGNIFGNGF